MLCGCVADECVDFPQTESFDIPAISPDKKLRPVDPSQPSLHNGSIHNDTRSNITTSSVPPLPFPRGKHGKHHNWRPKNRGYLADYRFVLAACLNSVSVSPAVAPGRCTGRCGGGWVLSIASWPMPRWTSIAPWRSIPPTPPCPLFSSRTLPVSPLPAKTSRLVDCTCVSAPPVRKAWANCRCGPHAKTRRLVMEAIDRVSQRGSSSDNLPRCWQVQQLNNISNNAGSPIRLAPHHCHCLGSWRRGWWHGFAASW